MLPREEKIKKILTIARMLIELTDKSLCKNIKRINNWYDEKFFFFFISLREKLQRYEITLLQQRRSKKYVD